MCHPLTASSLQKWCMVPGKVACGMKKLPPWQSLISISTDHPDSMTGRKLHRCLYKVAQAGGGGGLGGKWCLSIMHNFASRICTGVECAVGLPFSVEQGFWGVADVCMYLVDKATSNAPLMT